MELRRTLLAGSAAIVAAAAAMLIVPGLAPPAAAASLTEVANFGDNPGGMRMHVYVPDARPAQPAIVVAMHGCGGSGPGFYSSSEFASLADQHGFIVVYPTATQQAGFGNCFDTWSDAAKRRGGGSDPVSIVSMVAYVQRQYGGDRNRVYATGSSSGGMMTNHMLALYPDVFRAGAAFMGVPFNCFANAADYPPGSSRCTGGAMDRTPRQWGDAVRQAYPGYTGARPPVQLWHGTNDTLVPYSLLQESIEQWTDVFGLSQTPTSADTPRSGWNRRRYADAAGAVRVEAYSIQGAGHSLPSGGMAAAAVAFFGLSGTTPTPPPTTTPPPAGGDCVASYRQVNAWAGGFQGEVTVRAGDAAVNGWVVNLGFAGSTTITQVWNGALSGGSAGYAVRNLSWNGAIPAGGSTVFGFLGAGTAAAPTLACGGP